ncbi:MAG: nucleoside hydrolase [Deinococcales bacterium]
MKIILDCDPGHDDALAIMLALSSPELEVLGISVTYGNVGLENTLQNALKIRELCGSSVPVFSGAALPLVSSRISAEYVHGRSGLDGPQLPTPQNGAEKKRAVDFIIDSVLAYPHEVTLCPVGPLTNVALAMRLEPKIVPLIQQIVLMGGSTTLGNWSPAAEFNILCDPHAAKIVFDAPVKTVMFGLNVTHQALALPQHIAALRQNGNQASLVAAELLEFFKLAYNKRYGYEGPALHDPCVLAYLLKPELFGLQTLHVEVDDSNGASFGRTVVDLYGVTGKTPNTDVAMSVDASGYFALLTQRLARLP